MHCPKCGVEAPDDATLCPSCGAPNEKEHGASSEVGQHRGWPAQPARVVYAGFWRRAAAYLLDSILLGFTVGIVVIGPLMGHAGLSPDNPWVLFTGSSRQVLAINLLTTMVFWLYWALMESSPWRATFGKRILKLEVTDLAGKRISFARASGRYFGKMLSGLFFLLGFVMAGFTAKKQALHDILARCLVVRKI